jgi:hypothetical protein
VKSLRDINRPTTSSQTHEQKRLSVPIHIPWLSSARRLLSQQLDRLQQTLTSLGQTLRDRIAQVVGQSVSGIVREAVHAVLEQLHGEPGHRRLVEDVPPTRYDPRGLFSDADPPEERYLDERFPDADFRDDDPLDDEPWTDAQPTPPRPLPRWRAFLAAVLQAVSWWLRRGFTYPWLTASAVGVVVVSLLFGCPLLGTGIGIVRSACDLLALANHASASVGTLAGWLTP